MNILELSEQEIVRRNSLDELRRIGIEPYPAAEYVVTGYSDEIKANFVDIAEGEDPAVVGRQVSVRFHNE